MEKLGLKSFSSQVKIMGTIITIAGALVVVLYEGPVLIRTSTSSTSVFAQAAPVTITTSQSDRIKGGALLAAEYVMVSIWYIFQVHTRIKSF